MQKSARHQQAATDTMEMDDLTLGCKKMLAKFRIKELKDVLGHIGVSKQGKKQVLIERIVSFLTPDHSESVYDREIYKKHVKDREGIAKFIEDTQRKMQRNTGSDLASDASHIHDKMDESNHEASCNMEYITRCPCGSSVEEGTMIQCDGSNCGVWQHLTCVVIPENASEEKESKVPSVFYCEICRISLSDPFSVSIAHPLRPTKLITSVGSEGSSPLQSIEKSFVLSRSHRELLQKPEYDLQAWCTLLSDDVYFRMHWPQYASLTINGVAVRVVQRGAHLLLGVNGRDYGAGIMEHIKYGANKLSFSAYDNRQFCLGVRIIRKRRVEEVLTLLPPITEGEPFEEAIDRVQGCMNKNSHGISADGENDLEVLMDSMVINLRCPLSGARIKVAGRFRPCTHMSCFDLRTYIELNQKTKKWQCPICMKNYLLENIVIDQYVNRIVSMLETYPEDVVEVEVKTDASWRPKVEGEARHHEKWHLPDGTILGELNQDEFVSHNEMCKIKKRRGEHHDYLVSGDIKEVPRVLHKSENHRRPRFQQDMNASSTDSEKVQSCIQEMEAENVLSDHMSPMLNDCKDTNMEEADIIILSDSDDESDNATDICAAALSEFADSVNQQSYKELTNDSFPDMSSDEVQYSCNGVFTTNCPCPNLRPSADRGSTLNKSNATDFLEQDVQMMNSAKRSEGSASIAPSLSVRHNSFPQKQHKRAEAIRSETSHLSGSQVIHKW